MGSDFTTKTIKNTCPFCHHTRGFMKKDGNVKCSRCKNIDKGITIKKDKFDREYIVPNR